MSNLPPVVTPPGVSAGGALRCALVNTSASTTMPANEAASVRSEFRLDCIRPAPTT
jgi:hypothetical protein